MTQLEHDQLPSLRLLASAIHAVAFLSIWLVQYRNVGEKSLVRFLFETTAIGQLGA